MHSVYYFVLAVLIAVIGISVNFKFHIDKMKDNPTDQGKIQTKFFIANAIIEIIPIILVVWGFMNTRPVSSTADLLIPIAITIIATLFGVLFIFLQSKVDVTEEIKAFIRSFTFIGLMMILAFPIIAIVAMLLMLNMA